MVVLTSSLRCHLPPRLKPGYNLEVSPSANNSGEQPQIPLFLQTMPLMHCCIAFALHLRCIRRIYER